MRGFWMPFLSGLARALASRSVPLNTTSYQQLTQELIKRWDEQVLGSYPAAPSPRPPRSDRSRSPSPPRFGEVSCSCKDCKHLNRFLRDNYRNVARYNVDQDRRQHLEESIKDDKIPCTCATEEQESAQILVIKKKSKDVILQERIHEWEKQQKTLYASLNEEFEPEHLKTILGDEEFARIRSLAGM
ncbi:hypothetical protein PCANC_11053 [Puccinia coronata f. sp. avenae]|uniref:Uncharacterized protein n=1 Tax=Puccinia coronata f. sp. avenae TaxID=200324 RepID=A0A2N5UVV9_9BASI|nr:hypothetical protein PCASD_15636 [Puccinia coronata f. sp. avenae]PLW41893.1 hypothetical protein PCANC_11053 [Puccinia coronata f. sp. avenae]